MTADGHQPLLSPIMPGDLRVHHKTGQPLADEPDRVGVPPRPLWATTAEPEGARFGPPDLEGELVSPADVSSARALTRTFRREQYRRGDPEDTTLSLQAAVAFRRVKAAADGRDDIVWFAALEYLYRHSDRDPKWALAVPTPGCPHCGSLVAWRVWPDDRISMRCGSSCRSGADLWPTYCRRVRERCEAALDVGTLDHVGILETSRSESWHMETTETNQPGGTGRTSAGTRR